MAGAAVLSGKSVERDRARIGHWDGDGSGIRPARSRRPDRLVARIGAQARSFAEGIRPSAHAAMAAQQPAESLVDDHVAVHGRLGGARGEHPVAESLVWTQVTGIRSTARRPRPGCARRRRRFRTRVVQPWSRCNGWSAAASSLPDLPPLDVNPVERPLGRWNSDVPEPSEIPAEIPAEITTIPPGASGKCLQRIGYVQRQQVLELALCEPEPLVSQAILDSELTLPSRVIV